MSKKIINGYDEFASYLGKEIGVSDYHQITQEQINKFAEATIDHQWIHTDPERCKTESQYGTTIAHGYLTLSLLPYLWEQIVEFKNVKMMVNYGIENLRFNQAVPVNGKVRLRCTLQSIKDLRGTTKTEMSCSLEVEGAKKPAFEATVVFLYHFNK
ncbi:MAG: MaoC family dehydratase [Bacteroidota bacterium]|nr:MAG: MaoC family dehydratase [Bacteroidota bacterium]